MGEEKCLGQRSRKESKFEKTLAGKWRTFQNYSHIEKAIWTVAGLTSVCGVGWRPCQGGVSEQKPSENILRTSVHVLQHILGLSLRTRPKQFCSWVLWVNRSLVLWVKQAFCLALLSSFRFLWSLCFIFSL